MLHRVRAAATLRRGARLLLTMWLVSRMRRLALMAFMRDLTDRGAAVLTWRHKCNVPVNLRALQSYLLRKPIEEEDLDSDRSVRIKKVAWDEPPVPKWRVRPPMPGAQAHGALTGGSS